MVSAGSGDVSAGLLLGTAVSAAGGTGIPLEIARPLVVGLASHQAVWGIAPVTAGFLWSLCQCLELRRGL